MKLTIIKQLLVISLSITLFSFQCNKESVSLIPKYQFVSKIDLFPYKKIYNIGDTIWLSFQTSSKTLFDRTTSSMISTDSTFLNLILQYSNRYSNFLAKDTMCYTITSQGLNQNLNMNNQDIFNNYLKYQTNCNELFYQFKVGFIPVKKGIYSINDPSAILSVCPNRRNEFPYSTLNFTFNLTDCNKDIYLSIPPVSRGESVQGHTEGKIDRKEVFCFKVE
jgi:hypothetical protein